MVSLGRMLSIILSATAMTLLTVSMVVGVANKVYASDEHMADSCSNGNGNGATTCNAEGLCDQGVGGANCDTDDSDCTCSSTVSGCKCGG